MSLADRSLQFFPVSARVSVLRARGLRIKGKDGTNDAYAALQAGRETFRTPVSEKRAEPEWGGDDAAFIFTLPPEAARAETDGAALQVRVLHRVPIGADKLLGLAVVDVHELRRDGARENPQWFKLFNKAGKADKERGEVLLDVQFLKSSMSVSMIDLSDKSHSRLGKFKDKLRGKKKDGLSDSASAIIPSVTQVLTDSEGEMDGETETTKKKKNKLKSLFVPKSSMKRNSLSQSMSSLGTLPDKNSSISSSTSSGLNVESSEGKKKKKFTFLTHKRTGSSDSRTSNQSDFTVGSTNQNPASQIDICINGGHVYREETRSEEVQEMDEEEEEENEEEEERWRREREEQERLEEVRRREAEEERKKKEREEQRRKEEEEKGRLRMEREKEERRRMEEEERERIRIEREKEERRRMEEEERETIRMEREREERRKMEDERLKGEMEKERIRMEREKEERIRMAEEERERIKIEREKEERRKMEEKERERIIMEREKEERRRMEEVERIRMEREKEERRRMEEEERETIRTKREKEEERRRIEKEERRRAEEEEKERIRLEREKEEKRRMDEEERERQRIEIEERRTKMEEERKRKEEREAEELRRQKESDRKKAEEERMMEEKKEAERKRMMEEDEKQKAKMERKLAEEKKTREEEKRRIAEENEKRRKEEEEEKERTRADTERKRNEEEKKKKEKQMRDEQEKLRKEENLLFEERVTSQSTDFTRSARMSNVKPSVSVPATVSQPSVVNTNPFLDDDLDSHMSESLETTARKGRAPSPPHENPQLTGPDGSQVKEVSKRPAPQPPGTLKMTREAMDQAGLGEDTRKIPEKKYESEVTSVSDDDAQADTNPFTSEEPKAVKPNQRPTPKPRNKNDVHLEEHLKDRVKPVAATPNTQDFYSIPQIPIVAELPNNESSQKKTRAPLPPSKPKRTGDPSTPHQPPRLPNKTNLEQTHDSHGNEKNRDNAPFSSEIPSARTSSTSLAEKPQVRKPCAVERSSGSQSRTLPLAKVPPTDAGEVKEHVVPTSVIRQHAVKPLSAAENQTEMFESRVSKNSQPKSKAEDAVMKGPYSQLTQAELISLALRQQEQISQRDARIQEMEQYIDNLLVRVMEEQPSILMSLNAMKKSV